MIGGNSDYASLTSNHHVFVNLCRKWNSSQCHGDVVLLALGFNFLETLMLSIDAVWVRCWNLNSLQSLYGASCFNRLAVHNARAQQQREFTLFPVQSMDGLKFNKCLSSNTCTARSEAGMFSNFGNPHAVEMAWSMWVHFVKLYLVCMTEKHLSFVGFRSNLIVAKPEFD